MRRSCAQTSSSGWSLLRSSGLLRCLTMAMPLLYTVHVPGGASCLLAAAIADTHELGLGQRVHVLVIWVRPGALSGDLGSLSPVASARMSDASAEDDGRSAGGTSARTAGGLEVLSDSTVVCKFCRCSAADENPFLHSRVAGAIGPYRPWSKYVKKQGPGGSEGRAPFGKICLICMNTYNCLGLSSTHKSMTAYWQHCIDNASTGELSRFQNCVKEYTKQQLTHPGRSSLQNMQALRQVHTTLDVEARTGSRLKRPKKEPLAPLALPVPTQGRLLVVLVISQCPGADRFIEICLAVLRPCALVGGVLGRVEGGRHGLSICPSVFVLYGSLDHSSRSSCA